MATHSSILAWRISWTEEPGGLQSVRTQLNNLGHQYAINCVSLDFISLADVLLAESKRLFFLHFKSTESVSLTVYGFFFFFLITDGTSFSFWVFIIPLFLLLKGLLRNLRSSLFSLYSKVLVHYKCSHIYKKFQTPFKLESPPATLIPSPCTFSRNNHC